MAEIINFLYCIDFPQASDHVEESDKIVGWLLCSQNIESVRIPDNSENNYSLNYGLSRPDVAGNFKDFPNNDCCGFSITAEKKSIIIKNEFNLEIEVTVGDKELKKINISLNLNSSSIQDVEVDENKNKFDSEYKKTEEKFTEILQKNPWLTIRMDITNKCNLKCIMCHYKEEEIFSQPTKNITADQLKHYLKDIGPLVKNIMLSCGFEPLMSKHFHEIVNMLRDNYSHMEIGLCTNGMLLNSMARKTIIEKNISYVILSFDGVTKKTLENIRIGASYEKIISNILALRDLKRKYNRTLPKLYMDFVLMNSNIHEAPAFVELCAISGIEVIDFRHLVGNVFFSEHEEMLCYQQEKYNYYRKLIIEKAKLFKIDVRLPEPFETAGIWTAEEIADVDLSDFNNVQPDVQTEEIKNVKEIISNNNNDIKFEFLSEATCLRPFNEIMIVDQNKLLPCSYYSDAMGNLDENNTIHSIFFNEKFQKVRKKKLQSRFDHNCLNCPVKLNLLPTDIAK
jgi:MoaA/NifB/PqqE/SkfB family radical SAM enzyme